MSVRSARGTPTRQSKSRRSLLQSVTADARTILLLSFRADTRSHEYRDTVSVVGLRQDSGIPSALHKQVAGRVQKRALPIELQKRVIPMRRPSTRSAAV